MATTTANLGMTLPAVSDPADIGALNENFKKIDEKCNPALFAPSGYGGYGETLPYLNVGDTEASLEAAFSEVLNGMASNSIRRYSVSPVKLGDSTVSGWSWATTLYKTSANYATLVMESGFGNRLCRVTKTYSNGVWQPVEWDDPPMQLGVEYRTTERWNGKPVYRKCISYINTETLSGDTLYSIPHGIDSLDRSYGVIIQARTQGYNIPYMKNNQSTAVTGCSATNIELSTNGNTSWMAGRTWYFDMKYVKS